MRIGRRRQSNALHLFTLQQVCETLGKQNSRVERPQLLQPSLVVVGNADEFSDAGKIAYQIRAPISSPDNSYSDHYTRLTFPHLIRPGAARR
jgi:hypothetical protein